MGGSVLLTLPISSLSFFCSLSYSKYASIATRFNGILIGMKILITPLIQHPKSDAAYYITQNLAALLNSQGHVVAISADQANAFHYASAYPAPQTKKPSLLHKKQNRSYEEWMYEHGAMDEDYLREDMESLLEIIDHFQPDRILTIDRLAAVSAGRLKNVPVDAIVNAAIYKAVIFPSSVLEEYNAFLSSYKLEQVLSLKETYAQCQHRFGFGPVETQPFTIATDVKRIGITSVYPVKKGLTNRVCVFLPDVHKPAILLRKILSDAFLGAPYAVYIWYPGCKAQKLQNIHFIAHPRADMIPGSICVIHDGNDYYMNQCIAQAIPQVIIASREYARMYNGQAVQRNGIGRYLYEEDLTMGSLYENFRTVLADDSYYDHNQEMKEKITAYGDLTEILQYWK